MSRLAVLALFALLALPDPARAQQCQFVAPADWSSSTSIRWFGACPGGGADGLGVLRSYFRGAPGPAFFGRMVAGTLDMGVIEGEGGFTAGRFRDGEVVAGADRQTLIDAFTLAAKAARATAARFKAEGNAASARFYADKADQLENQMD